ncbi:MAG: threonylcarbamoyl-AMP synthase [Magnetovibrio sp.]|nr:threonylcarbamoyl-AMP synthase [Magnetovibrio sp.]
MPTPNDLPEFNKVNTESLNIIKAANIIRAGGLVSFPTETVYGIGADATNDKAVAAIFGTKQRPHFNPLIIHIKSVFHAFDFAQFNQLALELTLKHWPGALTLVLKRKKDAKLSFLATAGLDTVALRVPNHPVAQAILNAANVPIAAPSANKSGYISPTRAAHVEEQFSGSKSLNLLVDGGPCKVGLESTIVDMSGDTPTLLRPGGLATQDIEAIVGPLTIHASENIIAPGQLKSHYAPSIPLRMNVLPGDCKPDETYLGFGSNITNTNALNLSQSGNFAEAAANLFSMMRRLDNPENNAIAVAPIPDQDLGLAINDRLRRASA